MKNAWIAGIVELTGIKILAVLINAVAYYMGIWRRARRKGETDEDLEG